MTISSAESGGGSADPVRVFLCGDLMLGRGIDQILPHPSHPGLYEPYIRDARDYVSLAEAVVGPLPRHAVLDYVWGDALAELARRAPELRVANLETSITRCDQYWHGKDIHYRMHPANAGCLSAARLDCCTLANNHVLDWGYVGLSETLASLRAVGIASVGAGECRQQAQLPALFPLAGRRRVIVIACGAQSSGIPAAWAAGPGSPGVDLLADLSDADVERIARRVAAVKQPHDVLILSIHWGSNWGYGVSSAQRRFAHALIDHAGVDLVHGHSSHHPRPIEVYREHLILYGCGDFLNDYEGIGGYRSYRGDLSLMYFADIDADDGRLLALHLCPMQIRRFRAMRASPDDTRWLGEALTREGRALGTRTRAAPDGGLALEWHGEG